MPTFDISINIYLFALTIFVSLFLGYARRSRQLAKKQRRIVELERDMVQAHAELLESQREYCQLEARMKEVDNPNPVIAMKNRPTGTD